MQDSRKAVPKRVPICFYRRRFFAPYVQVRCQFVDDQQKAHAEQEPHRSRRYGISPFMKNTMADPSMVPSNLWPSRD